MVEPSIPGDPGALGSPPPDCPLCPRLAAFRAEMRAAHPDWHNAPVPSFGPPEAGLLVVGLAPGMKGANRTGRPFTGDFAGDLLYSSLLTFGLAEGLYRAAPSDGLCLRDVRICNAVRCLPPENKPATAEIAACNPFLKAEINAMPRLQVILALGAVAHGAVLQAFGLRKAAHKFAHGALVRLPAPASNAPAAPDSGGKSGIWLLDSYHCSRYNTSTRRLTPAMFDAVIARARDLLRGGA